MNSLPRHAAPTGFDPMDRVSLRLEAIRLALPRDIANPDMGMVLDRAEAIVTFVLKDEQDPGDTGKPAPAKGSLGSSSASRKTGHERGKLTLPGVD